MPPKLEKIHNVFNVSMLQEYKPDPFHILATPPVKLREDLSYEAQPIRILDRQNRVLRSKTIPMVKVLWRSATVEEETWEPERMMRDRYPQLFQQPGKFKF